MRSVPVASLSKMVTKNELGYMFVIFLYVVFLCSVVLYVMG